MSAEKKIKVKTVTITFLDNGFTVKTHAYNPYGADQGSELIATDLGAVITAVATAQAKNTQIDAENEAAKKKEAEEV